MSHAQGRVGSGPTCDFHKQAELWKSVDRELQPPVESARRVMEALSPDKVDAVLTARTGRLKKAGQPCLDSSGNLTLRPVPSRLPEREGAFIRQGYRGHCSTASTHASRLPPVTSSELLDSIDGESSVAVAAQQSTGKPRTLL